MEAFEPINFLVETKSVGSLGNVLLGLGAYIGKSFMLYQPTKDTNTSYEYFNIDGKNFNVKTEDGISIAAHLFTLKGGLDTMKARPTVIYFHENAGSLADRFSYFGQYVNSCQVNLLCFGYRGYTRSNGHPSMQGIMRDADAVMKHVFTALAESLDLSNLYLHGKSIGGGAASYVASKPQYRDKLKGVVLDTTFNSVSALVAHTIPSLSHALDTIFENESWPVLLNAKNFDQSVPVLVIGVANDEICPYEHSVKLQQELIALERKVVFETFEVGGHNDYCYDNAERYYAVLKSFYHSE